jgi:hypothetical protein
MKSYKLGEVEFLDDQAAKKFIEQLEKDLSARPALLRTPERSPVKWVFDSRKTSRSAGEISEWLTNKWTEKMKKQARARLTVGGKAGKKGPSLSEIEKRIDDDAANVKRALDVIIEVY